MTELMSQAISAFVEKQFSRNEDQILAGIFSGTNESMSSGQIYSTMIHNSMRISVELSVKIMSELLLAAGTIEPADEEQLRKTLLSVVKE